MPFPRHNPTIHHQRGASLMVMLVILVIGIATMLVGSLSSSALNNSRQQQTAAALAQARDALIGRAASDTTVPGSLPCPDSNDDGSAELMIGNDCPHYIGRLPWRTLGLTELRDGYGEHLWYALSQNFRDDSTAHINSDTSGTLNITGTQTANNVVAIIFSAGNPLPNQNRSPTQTAWCSTTNSTVAASLCANNYLEGSNNNPSNAATPNTGYQAAAPTNNLINDQLLAITHDQLMNAVEKRIAREVKSCLDAYAAASGNRYPWAAPATSNSYQGAQNTYFGRLPTTPIAPNSVAPEVNSLIVALAGMQSALAAYIANNTAATRSALNSAGSILENAAQTAANNQPTAPVLSGTTTSNANSAGDRAQDLAKTPPQTTLSNVQSLLANSLSALQSDLGGMLPTWPAGCIVTATYWNTWRDEMFYQVAAGFQPQPGPASNCGSNCLSLNGSGIYRAVVAIGRRALAAQNRALPYQQPPIAYLEGINPHNVPTPTPSFESYQPGTPNYQNVNDLVLCLDGRVNCL